jgi:hypothetical protein
MKSPKRKETVTAGEAQTRYKKTITPAVASFVDKQSP